MCGERLQAEKAGPVRAAGSRSVREQAIDKLRQGMEPSDVIGTITIPLFFLCASLNVCFLSILSLLLVSK